MVRWALIVASLFVICESVAQAADRRVRTLAEFEVAPDGDFLVLPLIINRREYPFLLSTGLSVSIIDEKLREELALPAAESQGGGGRGKKRYKLHARLGNADLIFPSGVETGDYTAMREGLDIEFYGELGMDAIRGQILQIDFDEGILRFLQNLPTGSGEAIRIFQPGQEYAVPIVNLNFSGEKPQRFFVSTARAGNSLDVDSKLLDELEEDHKLTVVAKEKGVNRSGTRSFQTARINEIQIGSFRHEGIIGNAGEGNVIGLSYLARYLVTFDFPHGKMYLKKGEHFDAPDTRLSLCGLGLDRDQRAVMVTTVPPHGGAARLGLEAGDRLDTLNGRRVQRISNWQIRRVLGNPDIPLAAEVTRAGRLVKLKSEPVATTEVSTDRENSKDE